GRAGGEVAAFQRRAFEAASIARAIVDTSANEAFVAALLCDVGELALRRCAPDLARAVTGYMLEHRIDIYEAQKCVMGSTHAEIGAALLAMWGLPQVIVDAVACHHEPGRDPRREIGITAAVHFAHHAVSGEPLDEAYFTER